MKQLNCFYILFFSIGWSITDFTAALTPMIIKFILIAIITPIVAIYMLYEDQNTENPSFRQIAMSLLTSILFVWMGYEASIQYDVPVILGLIGSFAGGLSALPIIKKIWIRLPDAVGKVIDMLPEGIKKIFTK